MNKSKKPTRPDSSKRRNTLMTLNPKENFIDKKSSEVTSSNRDRTSSEPTSSSQGKPIPEELEKKLPEELKRKLTDIKKLKEAYQKLKKKGFDSWEKMTSGTKNKKDQELFKTFSTLRNSSIRTITEYLSKNIILNDSGSKDLKSDIDYGINYKEIKKYDGEYDETKNYYIPVNEIKDIYKKVKQIILEDKENEAVTEKEAEAEAETETETETETEEEIKTEEKEDFLDKIFDVNFYGHTFYYKIQYPFTSLYDDIYIYEFDRNIINIEKKENEQTMFAIAKLKHEAKNKDKYKTIYDKTIEYFGLDTDKLKDKIKILEQEYNINNYTEQLKELDKYIYNNRNIEPDNSIRNKVIYETINNISLCDLYSKDSYATYGAFMHVVVCRQQNKFIHLHPLLYLHSAIENFSYFIHYFNKTTDLIKSSKYLMRFYDAYCCYCNFTNKIIFNKFKLFNHLSIFERHKDLSDEEKKIINNNIETVFETSTGKMVFEKYTKKTVFEKILNDYTELLENESAQYLTKNFDFMILTKKSILYYFTKFTLPENSKDWFTHKSFKDTNIDLKKLYEYKNKMEYYKNKFNIN